MSQGQEDREEGVSRCHDDGHTPPSSPQARSRWPTTWPGSGERGRRRKPTGTGARGPEIPQDRSALPLPHQSLRLSLGENKETNSQMPRIPGSRASKMPTSPSGGIPTPEPGPRGCAAFHLAPRPRLRVDPSRRISGRTRPAASGARPCRVRTHASLRRRRLRAAPESRAQDPGPLGVVGYPRGERSLPSARDWPSPIRSGATPALTSGRSRSGLEEVGGCGGQEH